MNKTELMKTADLLRSLAVEAQDHAEYLRSFDNPLQDRSAAPTIPPGWRTFANKSAFEEYERELLERTKADMKREGISWEYKPEAPANPGFCCKTCGRGFDFGCRCPDY